MDSQSACPVCSTAAGEFLALASSPRSKRVGQCRSIDLMPNYQRALQSALAQPPPLLRPLLIGYSAAVLDSTSNVVLRQDHMYVP